MGRIRVKELRAFAPTEGRKLQVWQLVIDLKYEAYKVHLSEQGYVILAHDEYLEKLTNTASKACFAQHDLEIIDPPELNAKRTLVVTQADKHIMAKSAEDLKAEIQRTKPNLKITEVVHLPKAKSVFKVKMESSLMVRRCLEDGLLIFGQSFPTTALSQDVFISLPQCMKCYSYDHVKKNCPQPDSYTICSNCSSTSHTYRNCASALKKCISCEGDHPTLAARCPTRKGMTQAKAKDLREQSRVRSGVSYASATFNNNTRPQASPSAWKKPLADQTTIINTALIQANIADAAKPGCFQSVLDLIYKANGLTPVIIPKEARLTKEIASHLRGSTPANEPDTNPQQTTETNVNVASTSRIGADYTNFMDMEITRTNDKRNRDSGSDSDPETNSPPSKMGRDSEVTNQGTSSVSDQDMIESLTTVEQSEAPTAPHITTIPNGIPQVRRKRQVSGLLLYVPTGKALPKVFDHEKKKNRLFKQKLMKYSYTERIAEELVENLIKSDAIDLSAVQVIPVPQQTYDSIKQGFRTTDKQ